MVFNTVHTVGLLYALYDLSLWPGFRNPIKRFQFKDTDIIWRYIYFCQVHADNFFWKQIKHIYILNIIDLPDLASKSILKEDIIPFALVSCSCKFSVCTIIFLQCP